ncbi:MAG: site-specific DNA-methyltransferase, partial [Hymenobacter sp.]
LYRHEHIRPQELMARLYRERLAEANAQLGLFGQDYQTVDELDKPLSYYQHHAAWENRLILGDSLSVMTSLLEREGLDKKVQMVYLDPPYGIKYGSNWQIKLNNRTVTDGKDEHLSSEPEQIKAFRDTWELGIHSYLSYLRDRLLVARELLTESGSCFVQINSENVHLVRNLMDEVFGSANFISDITFRKKSIPLGATFVETMHDNIIMYAKNYEQLKFKHLFETSDVASISSHGPYALFPDGHSEKISPTDFKSAAHPKKTQYYRLFSLLAPSYSEKNAFDYTFQGRTYAAPNRGSWVVDKEKLDKLSQLNRLQPEGKNLSYRLFFDDFPYKKLTNLWVNTGVSYEKKYVVQTTEEIIKRCMLMCTDPGDLVLDPTCGSGTTAYVAEQWGRRWITIDTSRIALNIAKTRLMTASFPYYRLYDEAGQDIRQGFRYKEVPHITLKSLANDEPPATEKLYDQP